MKQNNGGIGSTKNGIITILLFVVFFVLISSSTSVAARRLLSTPAEIVLSEGGDTSIEEINHHDAKASSVDFSDLMGSEECDEKDEECVKRRMIAEAHLDYIYTQNHKQP